MSSGNAHWLSTLSTAYELTARLRAQELLGQPVTGMFLSAMNWMWGTILATPQVDKQCPKEYDYMYLTALGGDLQGYKAR